MATVSINIPDAQLQRVLDDLCGYFNYTQTKLVGETQGQFAKRKVAEQVTLWCRAYEQGVAVETAIASVNSGITIT